MGGYVARRCTKQLLASFRSHFANGFTTGAMTAPAYAYRPLGAASGRKASASPRNGANEVRLGSRTRVDSNQRPPQSDEDDFDSDDYDDEAEERERLAMEKEMRARFQFQQQRRKNMRRDMFGAIGRKRRLLMRNENLRFRELYKAPEPMVIVSVIFMVTIVSLVLTESWPFY